MKESLDRLRKADPVTYQRAFDWLKNVAWGIIKSDPEKYFLEPGPYPLRDAILQAVLQEAIDVNGWQLSISNLPNGWNVLLRTAPINLIDIDANSPAQALLAAYLSAIEGQA